MRDRKLLLTMQRYKKMTIGKPGIRLFSHEQWIFWCLDTGYNSLQSSDRWLFIVQPHASMMLCYSSTNQDKKLSLQLKGTYLDLIFSAV